MTTWSLRSLTCTKGGKGRKRGGEGGREREVEIMTRNGVRRKGSQWGVRWSLNKQLNRVKRVRGSKK